MGRRTFSGMEVVKVLVNAGGFEWRRSTGDHAQLYYQHPRNEENRRQVTVVETIGKSINMISSTTGDRFVRASPTTSSVGSHHRTPLCGRLERSLKPRQGAYPGDESKSPDDEFQSMATQQYRIVSGEDSEIHNEPHIEGSRITVREDVHARVEQR